MIKQMDSVNMAKLRTFFSDRSEMTDGMSASSVNLSQPAR